jgi:hypothetical protein
MDSRKNLVDVATVIKYACAHALATAVVWLAMFGAALGLGFKDRENWSLFDHVLSATAVPISEILTTPGRYLTWDRTGGFWIPALVTSLSWGTIIPLIVAAVRRLWLWRRRSQESMV